MDVPFRPLAGAALRALAAAGGAPLIGGAVRRSAVTLLGLDALHAARIPLGVRPYAPTPGDAGNDTARADPA